ncbi:MAG: hypothetical protein P8L78_07890 [Mariniblastus sp.]|nr:hypothetical protein [Mariniblastus sp.]MDG1511050.1 hypothetical protein [Mariniblastus sp.]MDG2181597.1 hypothetical protein [Mariniblastus sp.]
MVNQSCVFDVKSFGLTVIIRSIDGALRNGDKSGFLKKSEASFSTDATCTTRFAPVDQIEDELTIMVLISYSPSV